MGIINEEINRNKTLMGIITEQGSAFDWEVESDTWSTQKEARDGGKYCEDYEENYVGPKHYEGQYCLVQTNWYDWETSTAPKTTAGNSGGTWKCGVGCIVTKGEDR